METPSQEQMTATSIFLLKVKEERKAFYSLNIKELKNFRISLILYFLAYLYSC